MSLELSGTADALADAPLDLRLRGAGTEAEVAWRARLRDDDGRVWRGSAERPEDLLAALGPAKPGAGPVPALASLRPFALDVRAETADGAAASRTLRRRLLAEGTRVRRWREGRLRATLLLPPGDGPFPAAVLDGRGDEPLVPVAARLGAALLGSHGVVALCVEAGDEDAAAIAARLDAVPAAGDPPLVLGPGDLVVPAGIPVAGEDAVATGLRVAGWTALRERAGAATG